MDRSVPVMDRFWAKVVKSDEDSCWLWQGTTSRGYGQMWDGHRLNQAHRFAYELLRGPIPAGLHIDHLCRVRAGVNPAHLEVVTCRENILRGESLPARNAQKTSCVNGHPLTPENVGAYGWKQRGRRCRMCDRAFGKKYYYAKGRDRRAKLAALRLQSRGTTDV